MTYRRCGRSGLQLPAISSACGRTSAMTAARQQPRDPAEGFDLGITHFDLANNYGPPYGSAETNFGGSSRGPPAVSRRARDLDEGRLRHVAGSIRRVGLA